MYPASSLSSLSLSPITSASLTGMHRYIWEIRNSVSGVDLCPKLKFFEGSLGNSCPLHVPSNKWNEMMWKADHWHRAAAIQCAVRKTRLLCLLNPIHLSFVSQCLCLALLRANRVHITNDPISHASTAMRPSLVIAAKSHFPRYLYSADVFLSGWSFTHYTCTFPSAPGQPLHSVRIYKPDMPSSTIHDRWTGSICMAAAMAFSLTQK